MKNRRLLDSNPEILSMLEAVLGPPTGTVPWSLEVVAPAGRRTGPQGLQNNIKTVRDSANNKNVSLDPVPVAERKAATNANKAAAKFKQAKEMVSAKSIQLREQLAVSVNGFFSQVTWDGSLAASPQVSSTTNSAMHPTAGGLAELGQTLEEAFGERILSSPVSGFFAGVKWDGSGGFVAPQPVASRAGNPFKQKHPTGNVSVLSLEPKVEEKSAQSLFNDFGFD